MPPQRTKRSSNSTVRRRELAQRLSEVAMRPCNNCRRLGKTCLVGVESDRCAECVAQARKCDLAPSPGEWDRIEKERKRVFAQVSETMAKASRLQKQLESLEKRKQELVERELRNIEELERDEHAAAPDPNDLLFNVSSDSFVVPEDFGGFDWSPFPTSHETAAEAPGSSQGS